jgi:hypothetical protein
MSPDEIFEALFSISRQEFWAQLSIHVNVFKVYRLFKDSDFSPIERVFEK